MTTKATAPTLPADQSIALLTKLSLADGQQVLLAQARAIIKTMECRCQWIGEECFPCDRCAFLEDTKEQLSQPLSEADVARTP